MSDLSFLAKKRYTTKAFDPTKTIPADKIAEIKTLLQFSPSSTNSSLGTLYWLARRKAKP